MSDILHRLRTRLYPSTALFTAAVGANACAAAPAVMQPASGTFTIGGPDKDVQDAINEIERLTTALKDIALCRIPHVPEGCTVGMEQFGPFAMSRARQAIGMEPAGAPPEPTLHCRNSQTGDR